VFEALTSEFDGAPSAVKAARSVQSGGKSGDDFKGLPITIRRKISGHEAAHRRRRRCAGRHDARSAALQPFLNVVKKKITGTLPRTHAAALAPKEGDPL